MDELLGEVRGTAYYLDDNLSLAESTCQFSANGIGRVAPQEGFYSVAIRKRGFRECVYRFADRDRIAARSTLAMLNRPARAA